ncbi:MAG: hypothetical protein ABSB70_21185 [Candidatus Velthaea sp.]|jgi:hypothetical protein
MLHPEAPAFIRVLLGLHIAAGTLALVVVPIVMSVHKGGRIHRRLGLVYVYAMFVVGATAVVVGPFFEDYFLLLIAVFSSYLTFSGWRVLARKDPARQPAQLPDWAAAIIALGAGVGMVVIGIGQRGHLGSFSAVLCVLGTICIAAGSRSIYQFFRPPKSRAAWLFTHFGSMLAAYIATVSAFSAVNFHFIHPVWLRWLWPTVVGSLVITVYTVRYQAKLAQGARLQQLVTMREASVC